MSLVDSGTVTSSAVVVVDDDEDGCDGDLDARCAPAGVEDVTPDTFRGINAIRWHIIGVSPVPKHAQAPEWLI